MSHADRLTEVRSALAVVLDPELDQSIIDLGFVSRVDVHEACVAVDFRLPTFWCSVGFAWLMAEDIREAVTALVWVSETEVRLVDHFASGKINRSINAKDSFQDAFQGEADGNLGPLRETFRRKAYLGRMASLIEAVQTAGWSDREIVELRIAELRHSEELPFGRLATRFLELRSTYGGLANDDDVAFRRPDGSAIDDLRHYLREIRLTRRGAQANGEMCKILLEQHSRSVPRTACPSSAVLKQIADGRG